MMLLMGMIEAEKMEAEEERVRWANHYSSVHGILLVGEGDFSFSLSLANAFGSASNIVATSLDQHDAVVKKYSQAESNLEMLKEMGAMVLHGIDATKMKLHPDLKMRKFDRIVFNFPHAGFKGKEDQLRLIKKLVQGFFRNASHMLRPYGEIHVSHKMGGPFRKWNLEELASKSSLVLMEQVNFKIDEYPGYNNKKGDGPNCDQPFPLGECCTFKFRIGDIHKATKLKVGTVCASSSVQTHGGIPISFESTTSKGYELAICDPRTENRLNVEGRPEMDFTINVDGATTNIHSLPRIGITSLCLRGFGDYVVDACNMFGSIDRDYSCAFQEYLRDCYEEYMNGAPGGTVSGYIRHLQELHRQCVLRKAWLERMLLGEAQRREDFHLPFGIDRDS